MVSELSSVDLSRSLIPYFIGYISRRYRPVHYSPSSRSALAEAELIYKDDHISDSVFVTFDLRSIDHDQHANSASVANLRSLLNGEDPVRLLVWTTTPWTLTANMGIAVNPELQYAVVRVADGLFIAAKQRLEALKAVIGEPVVLFELTGT